MLDGIKVVSFDAGFTLVEPKSPIVEVYYQHAIALGVKLPWPDFRKRWPAAFAVASQVFRSTYPDLATSDAMERRAWHRFTEAIAQPFPSLITAHDEWFRTLVEHFDAPSSWVVVEGALDLLKKLRETGVRIGVVSNWHSALHGILAGLNLRECVDFVLTSAEVGHKKPHPQIFAAASQLTGAQPQEILHIGDSLEEDVRGASACGIRVVHFNRGSSPTSEGTFQVTSLHDLTSTLNTHGDFPGEPKGRF